MIFTGQHDDYHWLNTADYDPSALLDWCPQAFVGKYIAITSFDCGPFVPLSEEEKKTGWHDRNEIAYSPRIGRSRGLSWDNNDEWYIFDHPFDLGEVWKGNVFEAPMTPGNLCNFVTHHLALHRPELADLVNLFWRQLDWIRPESYVAYGDVWLVFVTCDSSLFTSVLSALKRAPLSPNRPYGA